MDGLELNEMDAAAQTAFRRTMGCFATGVALVAAASPEGVAAITINSFSSVSLDPPLVLWCLGDRSDAYATFAKADAFGITICGADDHDMAQRFAAKQRGQVSADAFDVIHGAPVIRGGLAAMACGVEDRHTAGDHLILVGRVRWLRARDGDALTYFRGRFDRTRQEI